MNEQAAALAQQLGTGWTPQVWGSEPFEYQAKKGAMTVYPRSTSGQVTYMATIAVPSLNGSTAQYAESASDPQTAVTNVLVKFDSYIATLQGVRTALGV